MNVAVLGASGKAGAMILAELKKRGLNPTAIVRNMNKVPVGTPIIEKDVYHLTPSDISKFDVLVSALGFWGEQVEEFITSTKHLLSILSGQKTRLIVVGGAGSLYVDDSHTVQLKDTPDFPDSFKPLAQAMSEALALLEATTDVNWTFISPAADFDAQGPTTGKYVVAGEEFVLNKEGKSYISYGDYAIALVDEIESQVHTNQRFSVYGE